jgi:predicted amidohydrolase
MSIRVAQIRIVPEKKDLEGNHRKLMGVLDAIGKERPDVVVTPECFLDGYVSVLEDVTGESIREYGIDPGSSEYAKAVASWAAENDSWLILGCTRTDGDDVYNSALVIDRGGRIAGTYDKTHLQCHDVKYTPGAGLPVFDSDFGPFGVMICADRRWPETVRTLALGGARIVFNPTYGMRDERNLCMMRTRSYESEVFIAFTHPGQSLVTAPDGEVLCDDRSSETEYAVTDVDLSKADESRAGDYGHLKDRRSDIYL